MSSTPERVAVVTGGSRGIGRAISTRLAADGFTVVVNHASGTAAAADTVEQIREAGGRAVAVRADVADEHAVAAMFDRVEADHGGVDVVVHSAGRLALSTIADQDLDVLDALHRTNIRGTFVVAQQAARRLRTGGTFVGMSTSVVGTQFPTYGAYVASKSAVEGMTLILAKELAAGTSRRTWWPPDRRRRSCSSTARPRADRHAGEGPAARAARHAGGHRRGRGVPRRPDGRMGQRPDHPRQRRDGLMTDPRVVLVTGASSGFGRLTAEALARAGNVVVAGGCAPSTAGTHPSRRARGTRHP